MHVCVYTHMHTHTAVTVKYNSKGPASKCSAEMGSLDLETKEKPNYSRSLECNESVWSSSSEYSRKLSKVAQVESSGLPYTYPLPS